MILDGQGARLLSPLNELGRRHQSRPRRPHRSSTNKKTSTWLNVDDRGASLPLHVVREVSLEQDSSPAQVLFSSQARL
jgi:hypothetical protein